MGNFLFGLGIGITVGVLLAPKSGADTRRLIADKTAEGADYMMDQSRQLKNTAQDLIDRGRDTVMGHKQKLADTVSSFAESARREFQREAQ